MAAGVAFRIAGATTISQVESTNDFYLVSAADIAYEALPACEHCANTTKHIACSPCQKCGGTGKQKQAYVAWLDRYPEEGK